MNVTESISNRASPQTNNTTFGTIFSPEQICFAALIKRSGSLVPVHTVRINFCNDPFHYRYSVKIAFAFLSCSTYIRLQSALLHYA